MHPLINVVYARGWVDICHQNGILVNTWVADDEKEIIDLIKMNVDGVITNRPEVGWRQGINGIMTLMYSSIY